MITPKVEYTCPKCGLKDDAKPGRQLVCDGAYPNRHPAVIMREATS